MVVATSCKLPTRADSGTNHRIGARKARLGAKGSHLVLHCYLLWPPKGPRHLGKDTNMRPHSFWVDSQKEVPLRIKAKEQEEDPDQCEAQVRGSFSLWP